MSDTPRTDEHLEIVSREVRIGGDKKFAEASAWDFARQLERELNEANRLLDLARRHPYIPNSLAQILNEPLEPHKR